MGQAHKPRSGSMQFWPRKRARRETPRVRHWPKAKDAKVMPLGFGGYKVGMTHVIYQRQKKGAAKKGATEEVSCPVTIVECPPLRVAAVRLYKQGYRGIHVAHEVHFPAAKELQRKVSVSEKVSENPLENVSLEGVVDLRVMVYSQPSLTTIGKKKPELFELPLGGNLQEKLAWVKEHSNKEIHVSDVFKAGQQVDSVAVTKGKGFQGPVKRFGVSLRRHKSEKVVRGPGSLGPWCGQGHVMYRVAHAGQTGYHLRTEYNKWLLRVGTNPQDINTSSGYLHYGVVKNPYLLVKGSLQGPAKRFLLFTYPRRMNIKIPADAPALDYLYKVQTP